MPSSSSVTPPGRSSPSMPHIICFEHCDKKVFSSSVLPSHCPTCHTDLFDCDLKIPPFVVPSPFKRAQDYPCSIVVKPTKGDFLTDYMNKSNLHIALTNSSGFVMEYDQKGIHRDRTLDWNQCLVINLHEADPVGADIVQDPDWGEYWDLCLDTVLASPFWITENYNEDDHNCFAFILAFLRTLKQNPFSSWASSRVDFCQRFVLPKTVMAGKYIMLYRKLRDHHGIIVQ